MLISPSSRQLGLSPMQQIPTEILGEIFLHCLPPERHPSSRHAPLLLCKICLRWRSVALSLNQLWNEISLLYDYTNGSPNNTVWVAKQWFDRAGSIAPLSFTVCYIDKGFCNFLLKELMIPFANRLYHIDIFWDEEADFMPFFALCPTTLQSAALRFSECPDTTTITHIDVTSLRKMTLSTVTSSLSDQLCHEILSWGRLTHLMITESTDAQILVDLLSRCNNLQRGAFVVVGIDHRSLTELLPTLNQTVTLPHLYDFEMTLYRETGHSFLPLFRLHFPILRRLRFRDSSSNPGPILWGEGIHFTSQPYSVTDLSLSGYTMTPTQLTDLLRSTSGLVSLELDVRVNHNDLFQAMTRFPSRIGLVPLLEDMSLHLTSLDFPSFSSGALVDMVHSRQTDAGFEASSVSSIRNLSLLASPEGQLILDDVKSLLGERRPGGRMDRPPKISQSSHLFSLLDIDLASW
jgi:hypothetical protein